MRFVLTHLREADGPLTSRQITEAWCAGRGLEADDATYAALRKRIGACIKTCVGKGLAKDRGWTRDHGVIGPYELWGIVGQRRPAPEGPPVRYAAVCQAELSD